MNSRSKTRGQDKFWLVAIILLGVTLRVAAWKVRGLTASDQAEFETMAQLIVVGDWTRYLMQNRSHQPVYALLLAPKYLFGVGLAPYVFALHTLLAAATIGLVYAIATRVFSSLVGLLAAFLVAADLMLALWFPFTSGDVAFHFFLALCALTAVAAIERPTVRSVTGFAAAALLCTMTRPEGLFVSAAAALVIANRLLDRRFTVRQFAGLTTGAAVLASAVFAATLYYSKPVREGLLSSMPVSYALFISTQMSTSSPQEQSAAYQALGAIIARATITSSGVSPRYALSIEGLRYIRAHPAKWTGMYVLRLTSIVFPSIYSPWWSVKNRLYSLTTSVVLVGGALLACWFAGRQRGEAVALSLMAAAIALVASLFQREMDNRVPIAMDVVLACVAPFGWLALARPWIRRGSDA